jgi:hypothetical protein
MFLAKLPTPEIIGPAVFAKVAAAEMAAMVPVTAIWFSTPSSINSPMIAF